MSRRSQQAPSARRRTPRTRAQYEAYEAIVRAAEEWNRDFSELLKTAGLSNAQYNVLRILRGAGEAGLSCRQVGERLLRFDPDITRLLDRLERRGLAARRRDTADRRVVLLQVTPTGLDLLADLDGPVDAVHERQLGHFDAARLRQLAAIVEQARMRPAE